MSRHIAWGMTMIRKMLNWPGESNLRFYVACLGALAVAVTLFACGEADWMGMDCPEGNDQIQTAMIQWERTTDPKAVCKGQGVETLDRGGACIRCVKGGGIMSCIMYAEQPGVIADRVLGHEVKHAFGCVHRK